MTANLIAAAAVAIALVSFVVNFWWANAATAGAVRNQAD